MSTLSISGLHDIEESIFSPKWGMLGKVDASVQVSLTQAPNSKQKGAYRLGNAKHGSVSVVTDALIMPFEIKTGRAVGVMEHRAQTMLYTLLMEERYREYLSWYGES
jgi:DNA replication ATP-dependent helicase Dna2